VQVSPTALAAPSQATAVAVLFDDQHLYVLARLADTEPERISAQQRVQGRRLDGDDVFQVMLDPFAGRRNGYLFQINPNGVRADALIENERANDDWQPIWQGASWRDAHGWSAAIAIPFASLNYPAVDGQWGINFGRVIARHGETIVWSARGADTSPMAPAVGGSLYGLELPLARHALDIQLAGIYRFRAHGGQNQNELEPTLDIFYRPSSALTYAATFNTDFSTTEIDDREVNLSRFDIFLPEKREFFLQDTNIFDFEGLDANGRPFFSRRIGLDPDGAPVSVHAGGKLTGRARRLGYGLLSVGQDALAGEGSTVLSVARVQIDVLDQSRLGAIATRGAPDGRRAELYGLDFSYRNGRFLGDKLITAKGWYQESHEAHTTDANRAWGWGMAWPGENLHASYSYQQIEANFNPALGFVNRPNIRQQFVRGGYRLDIDGEYLRSFEPWLVFNHIRNADDGRLATSWLRFWPFSLHWHGGDAVEVWRDERVEILDQAFQIRPGIVIPAGRHRFSATALGYSSATHRKLSGRINVESGGFFDGRRQALGGGLAWRPQPRLLLSADAEFARVDLPGGRFKSRLVRTRSELALSESWSWSASVQYDNLSTILDWRSTLRWWPRVGQSLDLVLGGSHSKSNEPFDGINGWQLTVKYNHRFRR
jgi:hypothetical protein